MAALYIASHNRSMSTVRWLYKIVSGVVHMKKAEPYAQWLPLSRARIEYFSEDMVSVSMPEDGIEFDLVPLI